jgi:hypothetical protein
LNEVKSNHQQLIMALQKLEVDEDVAVEATVASEQEQGKH